MEHLEKKLNDIMAALEGQQKKSDEEVKTHGSMLADTKATMEKLQAQLDAVDLKIVEQHRNSPVARKSIKDVLAENDDVNRMIRDKKGRAIFTLPAEQASELMSQKTTLVMGGTGLGLATGGVIGNERMPSIVEEARRRLRIRDVLTSRPTNAPLIYYVKVSTPMAIASPQTEGGLKAENAVQFSTVTTNVQTIATFIPASKQILDDFDELLGFLRTSLPYYVSKAEEQQLLSGDGTGANLNGLITQASAFNTGLLTAGAGWTRIDQIGAAAEQIDLIDEIPATFVALNPRDWWNMRRTKDTQGRYLLGDPQLRGDPTLWGLTPVSTNAMTSGTFLVGNGDPAAAEIRDRSEMQFDISTEDSDNFRRNLVTLRCERRLALVVQRPQSFISGTFTTSPAGL
jgi:HK97 family phage major capsid protein